MKELLMQLSYAMGFDGEITQESKDICQRIIDNQDRHYLAGKLCVKDGIPYAIENMRISCAMRGIRRKNAV